MIFSNLNWILFGPILVDISSRKEISSTIVAETGCYQTFFMRIIIPKAPTYQSKLIKKIRVHMLNANYEGTYTPNG